MSEHYLVHRDGVSDLADILAQTQGDPLELSLDEVTVEIPGHPIAGENWAPQLAPFKPWVHDASLDGCDELDGTDGDLLIVGALGMGISDDERQSLIGDAVKGDRERPATTMTPHQMWEAGLTPPWHGGEVPAVADDGAGTAAAKGPVTTNVPDRETVEISRETKYSGRETFENDRETLTPIRETSGDDRFALNVPLTVREDGEGYALSAVHLSVLVEHGLPADDLVVVVPSVIGGRPVVRIASEAFARRFTSGARVRLLVVPDTVEVIGAQAFGSVCAEVVALGANVLTYDPAPLDLALPAPRLETRSYVVHPDNPRFFVENGCLLERLGERGGGRGDGSDPAPLSLASPAPSRLLFATAPYGERFAVPEGVRVMGAATFAKGCPPPRVVDAPCSLERVDGAVSPETVWRSADPVEMARIAARCGGRVTDFEAVDQEQCWYGFSEGDTCVASVAAAETTRAAHLVAGPPAPDSVSRRFSSAAHARMHQGEALSPREIAAQAASAMVAPVSSADRLALPREVQGAPLTSIAERALITAPATLVIPDTVREIRDGNAAKGTRKLMLPEGLRTIGAHCFCSRTLVGPVLIPASVTSIGEGSFEYAVVRLAAADAVVHITSDQLMSCFLEDPDDGIPFDFERYDEQLLVGRGLPDHLGALLHRLAAPFRLEPDMATRIVEALRERAADTMAAVAREGDSAVVRALAEGGFLDDDTLFDRQIERLRASNRTDCVLFLMNWRHEKQQAVRAAAQGAAPTRARDRFAL